MMQDREIEKRLNAVIDRWAPGDERERIARAAAHVFVPEIRKIIREEIRAAKRT